MLGADWFARLTLALTVNVLLAGIAYKLKSLDRSGWIAAAGVGGAVLGFLGWRGYLLLLLFFFLGSVATRLGYHRKASRGVAQRDLGRRGMGNVVANGAVAACCALLTVVTAFPELFTLAFAGAVAAATADTLESEIGQLRGGTTRLVTTFEQVPVGTDGGVSIAGTLAGVVGSVAIAICGGVIGLYPTRMAAIVAVAGLAATLLESVAGASLERRGILGNDAVNLINTSTGALFVVGLACFLI